MNTNKQHFQAFKREAQLLDLRDEGLRCIANFVNEEIQNFLPF
jgi:hypothetical protein